MRYNELAREIHENARAKGFWDKKRGMDEMLALAISELSEALEENRNGTPLIYYTHADTCPNRDHSKISMTPCELCIAKPEGLAIELADFIIRCLDTLHSLRGNPAPSYVERHGGYMDVQTMVTTSGILVTRPMPEEISAQIFELMRLTSRTIDDLGSIHRLWLARACREAVSLLEALVPPHPEDVLLIKMDYNTTRQRMHGKAY